MYYSRLNPGVAEASQIYYVSETPKFYQNDLAMKITADFTGGKPIAVCSQSISVSGVSIDNPLQITYTIHASCNYIYKT
jgi:hypothetical protein